MSAKVQGCAPFADVAHEVVFKDHKDDLMKANHGQGPTVCYAREMGASKDANIAYINALKGLTSCNLSTTSAMFHADDMDAFSKHEDDAFEQCRVYCAHEQCSAAAAFIADNASSLDKKCKEVVYIHDGVKALQDTHATVGACPVPNDDQCTSLVGKNIVITGGTRGLGFEQAKRGLQCGSNHVTITGRTQSDGEVAEKKLADIFGNDRVSYLRADASTVEGNIATFDPTARANNGLPSVVNHASLNAGIFGKASAAERGIDVLDDASFDDVMSTNCKGVFLGMQQFSKAHQKTCKETPSACDRYPSIVAIKSIYGSGASTASNAGYQASKFCVDALVKQGAVEFARPQTNDVRHMPFPIRVNSVSPGFAHTSMTDDFHSGTNGDIISSSQAHGKWVDPKDVARQVVALFDAKGVSGTDVYVDGGTSVQSVPLYDDAARLTSVVGCCGAER